MLTAQQMSFLYPYDKPVMFAVSDDINTACSWYKQSLLKQIIKHEVDNDIRLRPSLLGKAAIDVVARKVFPDWYRDEITNPRFWQLFHDGDTFEADYYVWLTSRGVEVEQYQVPCTWNDISGHADMVVLIDGKRVLLELKTANAGYFTSVQKMQSDDRRAFRYGEGARDTTYLASQFTDFRGHLTQAAVYGTGLGVDEIVVVLKAKDTSELILYNLTESERLNCIKRASQIVRAWHNVEEWKDVFVYTGIPAPNKEISRGSHTGRYLVNPKLYSSPILPLVYEWTQDKNGKIAISGYRIPTSAVELMNRAQLEKYHTEIGVYTYDEDNIEELIDEWRTAKAL